MQSRQIGNALPILFRSACCNLPLKSALNQLPAPAGTLPCHSNRIEEGLGTIIGLGWGRPPLYLIARVYLDIPLAEPYIS
jgi:hypothetical protein